MEPYIHVLLLFITCYSRMSNIEQMRGSILHKVPDHMLLYIKKNFHYVVTAFCPTLIKSMKHKYTNKNRIHKVRNNIKLNTTAPILLTVTELH